MDPTRNPTCNSDIVTFTDAGFAFQKSDSVNMKAKITVQFVLTVTWPYRMIDDYDPVEDLEIAENGKLTLLDDKLCEVPTIGDCSTAGCTHHAELTFDSSIMCSREPVAYRLKLKVENLEKEVQVIDYVMNLSQQSQCGVVTETDIMESEIALKTADYDTEDTRNAYHVKDKAYLRLDFNNRIRKIETVQILELAVTLEPEMGNPERRILHSSDTDKVDVDAAQKMAISPSINNNENVVTHEFYFHPDYFSDTENTNVKFEYSCRLAYFSDEDIQNNVPKAGGRRALEYVTVQDAFALGSKDTEFDASWPQPRRALQLDDSPALPLTMDVLVLPFTCSGDFTSRSASVGTYVQVQCGEKSMGVFCSANGWDFSQSIGDCGILQTFTFDVEVRGDPVPTCDNIVDTMSTLLGKPLQDSRCSLDTRQKEGSDPWMIATYEVKHTNKDISQDDIKSVLEDSSSFKIELEKQTKIQVGKVSGLAQNFEFVDVTGVEFSTSALPKTSTTTPVVAAEVTKVESSSGDDYTIHLIIGCIALVCICVGQYFWFNLSKSVQKIQEVYTGEVKEDEEAGSPKLIDLASDEGELQLKAAVSDEAVAIDPSMFLGELYDYYLTTNKTTEGQEGEGTNTTETNDWKFLLFE